MAYQIFCWLISKEFVNVVIQLGILAATIALVVVAWKQTKAAIEQARAATLQVEAARKQIESSERQLEEVLSQGRASRRPFLIVETEGAQVGITTVVCNKGPGIAYDVTWRFLSGIQHLNYERPGSLGVDVPIPLFYKLDERLGESHVRLQLSLQEISLQAGVRFEYKDSAGTHYWTVVTRDRHGYLHAETGSIGTEASGTIEEMR
jgi:hypothetical protein